MSGLANGEYVVNLVTEQNIGKGWKILVQCTLGDLNAAFAAGSLRSLR